MPDQSDDHLLSSRTGKHGGESSITTGSLSPCWPTVPGFAIQGIIQEGSRAVVYRARDIALEREVAIKVLCGSDRESPCLQRLTQAARRLAQLDHPGIPTPRTLGTLSDGRPYLVMPLLEGVNLAEHLASRSYKPCDLSKHIVLFEQLCQLLAHAHERRVSHGNLNLHNVLLHTDGQVRVLGWEVSAVEQGFDPQADVLALGTILAEILKGDLAANGSSSVAVGNDWALHDRADLLKSLESSANNSELAALARRSMHPDPSERPADAQELVGLLAAYRSGVEEKLRQSLCQQLASTAIAQERTKLRQWQLALMLVVGLFVIWTIALLWWHDRQASKWRLLYGSSTLEDNRSGEPGKTDRTPAPRSKESLERLKQLRRAQMERDAATRLKQSRDLEGAVQPLPIAPAPREIPCTEP